MQLIFKNCCQVYGCVFKFYNAINSVNEVSFSLVEYAFTRFSFVSYHILNSYNAQTPQPKQSRVCVHTLNQICESIACYKTESPQMC